MPWQALLVHGGYFVVEVEVESYWRSGISGCFGRSGYLGWFGRVGLLRYPKWGVGREGAGFGYVRVPVRNSDCRGLSQRTTYCGILLSL